MRIPKVIYTRKFREQAVRLHEVDGLTIPEVLRRLLLPAGTLKNRVYAARRVWAYFSPNFEHTLTNGFVGNDHTVINQDFFHILEDQRETKVQLHCVADDLGRIAMTDVGIGFLVHRRNLAGLSFLGNLTVQKKIREY